MEAAPVELASASSARGGSTASAAAGSAPVRSARDRHSVAARSRQPNVVAPVATATAAAADDDDDDSGASELTDEDESELLPSEAESEEDEATAAARQARMDAAMATEHLASTLLREARRSAASHAALPLLGRCLAAAWPLPGRCLASAAS